jgi:DNA-binding NarL/FixJ family response regulator
MAVRVLHCDDSEAFRVLVRAMLDDEEGIEVVGDADGAASVIAQARVLEPDVVLLDLRGGDLSEDLPARIATAAPGARVVVLSGWLGPVDETHIAARLGKDVEFAELARTLRRVGAGLP